MGRLAGDFARTAITEPGQSLTLGVELAGGELTGGELVDGPLVGDVVLMFHHEEHRAGEIGYVFAPQFQGHGYAAEAVAAVIDLGLAQLGLHRIVARLDARNESSARLCERLGLRREAHFVSNELFKGEWTDEVVYAVLAADWRRPAS